MKQEIKTLFFSGYLLLLPLVSFAQSTGPGGGPPGTGPGGGPPGTGPGGGPPSSSCPPGTLCNPLNNTTICGLLKAVLNVAIQLAIPVIILFLVYAGFRFVMARGNSTALTEARKNLMFTILGIALFLGAWTLAMVLVGTINALQPNSVNSC